MWNIRKFVKKGDYIYAVVPEHPRSSRYGYVLAHRVIMENFIDRELLDDEEIHHIDGNKKNNSIDNLMIVKRGYHQSMHSAKYPDGHCVTLICPECGISFERGYNQRPEVKGTTNAYCSRRCNGRVSMRVYRSGLLNQQP